MTNIPHPHDLEKEILVKWKKDKTFAKVLAKQSKKGEFTMPDGPPFPTGTPHHGTIFVSTMKDLVARYKTMRGHHVERQWGWDCHGLPIETQAEKNLGIKTKDEIEKDVKRFNDACRDIVSGHNEAWPRYIDALGRWTDMENAFRTMTPEYMQSVWWAFKELHKKGLIYKGFRVAAYCTRCTTPLSIAETRQDDSTRPANHQTCVAKFKINENTSILAWTTMPWTLLGNCGLAVNPKLKYVKIEMNTVRKLDDPKYDDDEFLILAKDAFPRYIKEIVGGVEVLPEKDRLPLISNEIDENPSIIEEFTGEELIKKYPTAKPPFQFADEQKNDVKIVCEDFVTAADGTGIVHLAPASGEEDFWAGKRQKLPFVNYVDENGKFMENCGEFSGKLVWDAVKPIIADLKVHGLLFSQTQISHNYPHCWRCDTQLIYKALDAWYVAVEKIKPALIAKNEEINWIPETVKHGRFGKWLENARDWNISRNRFWGTPLPVWECNKCENIEVISSISELETKSSEKITDLHKENIDPLTWKCKKCDGSMKRTTEVLDCWFDSGCVPFASHGYTGGKTENFEIPADFIVEYTGQLRGWFYTLHVLSVALFDKPAFKNCLVHGTLLAEDGKKISKSLKNYTDPLQLVEKYGADAMRAYFLSSPATAMDDMRVRDDSIAETMRSLTLPLLNALNFLESCEK